MPKLLEEFIDTIVEFANGKQIPVTKGWYGMRETGVTLKRRNAIKH